MNCFIYTLLASIAVVSPYPIFKQPRFKPQEINLPPEFALWPPRQEPAPMYGYPDFGDYNDPRPAYSELDIVREQLAHPQVPPLYKRFPSNLAYSYGEQFVGDDDEQNLVENEVTINKPALEMLTEALMETLVRQSQPDNNYFQQQKQESENDQIVQELKKTAVKKSLFAQPVAKTFEKTENRSPKGTGQKEIPLLRPPTNLPSSSTEPTSIETENKRETSIDNMQQRTRASTNHTKREQRSFVSTGDDLTKELNSLKKMFQ